MMLRAKTPRPRVETRTLQERMIAAHDPSDYPRLPPKVVEAANRPNSEPTLRLMKTILRYDCVFWRTLFGDADIAAKRMAIHRLKPWEIGGVVSEDGGYLLFGDERDHPVSRRLKARDARDFALADKLRVDLTITGWRVGIMLMGYKLFDHSDGTEFVLIPLDDPLRGRLGEQDGSSARP